MSLIFIDQNNQNTLVTKDMFEKITSDAPFNFGYDNAGRYLIISSKKGRLEVRSKNKILDLNELYAEFEKIGIILPFSIEDEHIYS